MDRGMEWKNNCADNEEGGERVKIKKYKDVTLIDASRRCIKYMRRC